MKSSASYSSEGRIGNQISRPTRLRVTALVEGVFGVPRELAERGEALAEYSVHFLGGCLARGSYQASLDEEARPRQKSGYGRLPDAGR